MTKELYIDTQKKLLALGREIEVIDLDSFLAHIRRAETVAPIVDPTLYRKAQANLGAIKALAESLLVVKKAYNELFETVLTTASQGHMTPPREDEP